VPQLLLKLLIYLLKMMETTVTVLFVAGLLCQHLSHLLKVSASFPLKFVHNNIVAQNSSHFLSCLVSFIVSGTTRKTGLARESQQLLGEELEVERDSEFLPDDTAISLQEHLGTQDDMSTDMTYLVSQVKCRHTSCYWNKNKLNRKAVFYKMQTRKNAKPMFYCREHRLQNVSDFFYPDPITIIFP
jgi:hypothetical protein